VGSLRARGGVLVSGGGFGGARVECDPGDGGRRSERGSCDEEAAPGEKLFSHV
jgi:hypothetical protein